MSLSKAARKCQFCDVGKGIYNCPRCSRKYCSSYCYKSREHESCSEAFFKDWVQETLHENNFNQTERGKMMDMLQNFEDESEGATGFDEPSIEERFAGLNLSNLEGSCVWSKLNDDEKAKFKSFVENSDNLDEIVPLKQPWWTNETLNLVTEIDSDANELREDVASRPPFPLNIKNLSEITSIKPSNCVPFNLVNILYGYAFLCRFYNCDLRDFLEEVVDSLFIFSPVLSEGRNYSTLIESTQDSIRLISSQHSDLPISFVKSIVDDVSNIMAGPKNARQSTFVLCALHDIKLLLTEFKVKNCGKGEGIKDRKKKLTLTIKKLEYYMGWSSEWERVFPEISGDLVVIMLPDLMPESNVSNEDEIVKVNIGKPLIEEVN